MTDSQAEVPRWSVPISVRIGMCYFRVGAAPRSWLVTAWFSHLLKFSWPLCNLYWFNFMWFSISSLLWLHHPLTVLSLFGERLVRKNVKNKLLAVVAPWLPVFLSLAFQSMLQSFGPDIEFLHSKILMLLLQIQMQFL